MKKIKLVKMLLFVIFWVLGNYSFAQNVGIGVNNPSERLEVNQKLKISNGSLNNMILKADAVSTQIEFNEGATNQVRLYESGGSFAISTLGNIGHMKWWPSGDITTAGGATLKINSTGNSENTLILQDENPKIEMNVLGAEKGYLQQLGVNLFMGTPYSNTLGFLGFNTQNVTRALIDKDGNFGIGTFSPNERLHVIGNGLFNATNPTIQLQNASADKGFLQLNGDNLRLGTNSGNTLGKIVFRNDGSDIMDMEKIAGNGSQLRFYHNGINAGRIYSNTAGDLNITSDASKNLILNGDLNITPSNRVGLGTILPAEKLHVVGNTLITGNTTTNGHQTVGGNLDIAGNTHLGAGKVTHDITGTNYNLVPVCYGRVTANGTKAGGTPNFTVSKPCINGSPGCYWINSPQITASSIIIINVDSWLASTTSLFATYHYQGNGDMGIYIKDDTGDAINSNFNFVVFDP